jgi:hypothetical protein
MGGTSGTGRALLVPIGLFSLAIAFAVTFSLSFLVSAQFIVLLLHGAMSVVHFALAVVRRTTAAPVEVLAVHALFNCHRRGVSTINSGALVSKYALASFPRRGQDTLKPILPREAEGRVGFGARQYRGRRQREKKASMLLTARGQVLSSETSTWMQIFSKATTCQNLRIK